MWVEGGVGRWRREPERNGGMRHPYAFMGNYIQQNIHTYERHEGRKRAIWGEEEDGGGGRGDRKR